MMATATEEKATEAPPSVLGAYLARFRHPATKRSTIIATVAAVVVAGGAAWWTSRRYRVGFADGHREGRMMLDMGDEES